MLTEPQKSRFVWLVAAAVGVPLLLLGGAAFWFSTPHVQFGSQPAAGYFNGHIYVTGFVVNVGGQNAVGAGLSSTVASQDGSRIAAAQADLGNISPQAQTPFYLKIPVPSASASVLVVQSSVSWTERRPFFGSKSFDTPLTTLRVEKSNQPPLDLNTVAPGVSSLAMSPAAKILTGPNTDAIAFGLGYLWATNTRGNSITRIDPSDNSVHLITVGNQPNAIATGFGSIWVGSGTGMVVWRLDPVTEHVVATVKIGGYARFLTTGEQGVWVGTTGGTVQQIDPSTNQIVGTTQVGVEATSVATGEASVWVSVYGDGIVVRVDPVTHIMLAPIPVGDNPWNLAVQAGSVWVPNISSVTRIDPATDQVVSTTAIGLGASSVAIDGANLWITSTTSPYVFKADARTGRLTGYVELDTDSAQAVFGGDSLWVLHAGGPGIPPTEIVPSTIDRLKIA